MSSMFYYCNSLESLPDISKWNTDKVTDISEMFYGCQKLLSLPDISKLLINSDINRNNLSENNSILNYSSQNSNNNKSKSDISSELYPNNENNETMSFIKNYNIEECISNSMEPSPTPQNH